MKLKYFLLSALLLPVFGYAQSPATLVGLTHSAYADSVFVTSDSSYLSYSNGRGSDVKITPDFYPFFRTTPTGTQGTYDHDSWYSGVFDSAHMYNLDAYQSQVFDSATGMLLSSTFSIPDSSGWKELNRINYVYDSMGSFISEIGQNNISNVWTNSMRQDYTYDPAHNLTSITRSIWNGTSWDNSTKYVYYYNFLNKVTSSLVQTWNGTSWANSEHNIYYSHDNNVTVDSVYYQQMVGPNWVTVIKDVYANDANGDAIASWHYNNGLLESGDSTSYNALHNIVSRISMAWDSASSMLVKQKQYNWSYNNYDQPTSMQSSTWDSSGFWIFTNSDALTTYYYSIDTTTRVSGVNSNISDLKLFPVPAQNTINIDMTWSKPEQFAVTIFDMQGRIVRRWSEAATASYTKTVPVMDLSTGNYFIVIKSASANTARQFSVAH